MDQHDQRPAPGPVETTLRRLLVQLLAETAAGRLNPRRWLAGWVARAEAWEQQEGLDQADAAVIRDAIAQVFAAASARLGELAPDDPG